MSIITLGRSATCLLLLAFSVRIAYSQTTEVTAGLEALTSSSELRVVHDQSATTPTYLVFREYLRYVDEAFGIGHKQGIHFLIDSLNLPHDAIGQEIATELAVVFRTASKEIHEEMRSAERSILCPESRANRSKDRIYQALDAIDDVNESIYLKHFEITANTLETEMLDALLNQLASLKQGFVYWKENHKITYEKREIDPHERVEKRCHYLLAIN